MKKAQELTRADVEAMFTYSRPTPERIEKHNKINDVFKEAALVIFDTCSDNKNREYALAACQQARMMANASIAQTTTPEESG